MRHRFWAALGALLLFASVLVVVPPFDGAAAQSPPAAEVIDVPHDWALIPDGVEAGDEFRLVFVTQEKRNARSSDIADYDAFVRTSAGSSSAHAALRAYAQHFKAVGSTSTVNARDHLGMDPNNGDHQDVPVYWVGGPRAAPGNSVVFKLTGNARSSVGWESVGRYASGAVVPSGTARRVWTGSRDDGTRRGPGAFLGAPTSAGWARAEQTSNHIIDGVGSANTNYSLYGMSAVFRAEAAPLVSNLGQSDGQFLGVVPFDRAQAFSTGSNATGYTLGGVDVEFVALSDSAVFSSKMTATVRSDTGGSPGAVVETLTNPAYQQTTADRVFGFEAPAGGVALAADATYWLVLDSDGTLQGNHRVRATASDSEDAGAEAGFSVADTSASRPAGDSTDNWSSVAESMKLSVRGSANPEPPPEPDSDGSHTVPHDWELVPSGLGSGDEFRLLFMTTSKRNAMSADIADYDAFVQSAAAGRVSGGSHPAIQRYASLFKALGSTSTVDARDHLGMNPTDASHKNAPVYWLNGGRLAFGNADVWDGAWADQSSANTRNQLGTANTDITVFTGSNADGTKHATRFLANPVGGNPVIITGSPRTGENPVEQGAATHGLNLPFYGVSPVFRVGAVPVPVSVDLLGVGSGLRRLEGQSVSFRVALSRPLSAGESVVVPLVVSGASDVVNDFDLGLSAGAANTGVSLDLGVGGFPFVVLEGAGAHAAAVDLRLLEDGVAESGAEALTVSLDSAARFRSLDGTTVAGGAVRGRSTSFTVDVYDRGQRPWVQFRTCPQGMSCSAGSDAGWVATAEGDAPPVVALFEGGSDVSYQYRLVDPLGREFSEAWVQVARSDDGYMGVGEQDQDRLICRSPRSRVPIGGQLLGRARVEGRPSERLNFRPHDSTSGCPHPVMFIGEGNKDAWQTVTVGAGHDPDAYDHLTHLVHRVGVNGARFSYDDVRLPVRIADDDDWEQDLEVSTDGGATWTAAADGGFGAALNVALTAGSVHSFMVRLANDPASIPGAASREYFTITSCTGDLRAPDSSQRSRGGERIRCLGPSHEAGISSPQDRTPDSSQRIGVGYGSPVTVNVHVDAGYAGPVHFRVDAAALYQRTDTDMPTYTGAPTSYRTQAFTYLKRFTACAGCAARFDRTIYFARSVSIGGIGGGTQGTVGDLSAFDLSDIGIGLRWPAVAGAEAYQVRWWPTAPATPGEPASQSYVSALVQHPGHTLVGLEPATEYRARVYYVAGGGVLLGSASPTIRFTTLAAGAPTQANPTSPVLEPVPTASISADGNVVEGGDAAFTVTLAPAPPEPTAVAVEVGHYGDGSAIADGDSGPRTVTVPASGTARFTVTTLDNTSPDPNGPLYADVAAGDGYRPHPFDSRAVVFVDNDDDPKAEVTTIGVSEVTDTTATIVWASQGDGAQYQVGWYQSPGVPRLQYATTTQTEHQITGLEPESGYQVFVVAYRGAHIIGTYTIAVATLAGGQSKTTEVDVTLPPPTPQVSIAADRHTITEGGGAAFTITAEPAPETDLQVAVTIAATGDYGASTGRQVVTVDATGTAALTVATTGDSADEPDGTITAVVDDDYGYTVSPDEASATVTVADDDIPQVSITAGGSVTEGADASFTITATPAPHAGLRVAVTVTQNGDHGAATGRQTVTIGTTGTATLTVATTDDAADEPDGTITATLDTPAADDGYTVSASQGAATVAVADDDVPQVSITAGGGVTEGADASFTITASPTPHAGLRVAVTVAQNGDYGAAAGRRTVTIPTSGTATLTVATDDDADDEPDGTITATLADGAGYGLGTPSTATVAVADDDDPPVEPDKDKEAELSITVEDASGTEGDVVTFRIILSKALTEELEVNWYAGPAHHLRDDRAQSSDYWAMSGQMVFTPGTTEVTDEIWLKQDNEKEPDEHFAVEAFLPGEWFTPAATGTMTITDDD